MVKFTSTQYALLVSELNRIAAEPLNILQRAERSCKAARLAVNEIKAFILTYSFRDKQEEIYFFKEIKPQFMRELLYYGEIYEIEAGKPVGGKDQFLQYYGQEVDRIRQYFVRHQVLYNYYRADKSQYDEAFYTREMGNENNVTDTAVELDNRFCTLYSHRLSKLQAFEMVNDYLQQCIYKLEHPEVFNEQSKERKFANLWTDSKVALIELAYALQARGAVNNGKGDIKQIITDLEIIFNVEVGNFYRTFQNMRIRKKNTTPFLDGLKESLDRKMEEDY